MHSTAGPGGYGRSRPIEQKYQDIRSNILSRVYIRFKIGIYRFENQKFPYKGTVLDWSLQHDVSVVFATHSK